MKTKNLLSRFSAAALVAAAALLPAALTSCSSEAEPNVPTPDPIPEGMARINFGISSPSIESTTRVDKTTEDATETQAKINSLYLYIFACDDAAGTNPTFVDRINCNGSGETTKPTHVVGDNYHDIYSHAFTPGYYKFYVVANIDNYLSKTDNKTILDQTIDATHTFALTDLTGANLTFTGTGQGQLLRATNGEALPMAADNKDVKKVTKDNSDVTSTAFSSTNGTVHIESGAYNIQMDMTFLCSAVRYTFLYDGTKGDYESAWNYDYFNVESLTLQGVTPSYTIFATTGAPTAAGTAADVKASGKNYTFTKTMAEIYADPSTGLTEKTGEWTDSEKKRAFQGMLYLPMNTTETADLKTKLNLGYKTSKTATESTVKAISIPDASTKMQRGYFYDVVGTLTTSGMEFYVTVKPWVKAQREVFPM